MTEADREWYVAFQFWYETGHKDQITSLLRDGIPPSPAHARFLADILDGRIKRPSGKQEPIYRAKKLEADDEIRRLHDAGFTRKAIHAHLVRNEYVNAEAFDFEALNQRMNRLESRDTPISNFQEVYEAWAKNKLTLGQS